MFSPGATSCFDLSSHEQRHIDAPDGDPGTAALKSSSFVPGAILKEDRYIPGAYTATDGFCNTLGEYDHLVAGLLHLQPESRLTPQSTSASTPSKPAKVPVYIQGCFASYVTGNQMASGESTNSVVT
jgi:hypothetical protein